MYVGNSNQLVIHNYQKENRGDIMKKLGLVGGMGPESTIPYYHDIVFGVQDRVGKQFFPNLTIESVNVFEILGLCEERKYEELTDYLLRAVNNLARSGADFAALSANTSHIVFDRLQELSPIPLISIIESTCNEAEKRNLKKIGLLGTVFTMKEDFYKQPFCRKGINIVVPSDEEMDYVNQKISSELEYGIVEEETLEYFRKIISRMQREEKIEAIILGCTELPLLLNDKVSSVPCLDTVQIHIQDIINEILK